MINRVRVRTNEPTHVGRDERSMRLVEYAVAIVAVGAAILLAVR
jgi:hypothetical protein